MHWDTKNFTGLALLQQFGTKPAVSLRSAHIGWGGKKLDLLCVHHVQNKEFKAFYINTLILHKNAME